jgi:hypothetical protein
MNSYDPCMTEMHYLRINPSGHCLARVCSSIDGHPTIPLFFPNHFQTSR